MVDEERERRKQRILGVFEAWGSPEEWRAFMRAHGQPDEAMKSLALLGGIVETYRWLKRLGRVLLRGAAIVTSLVIAYEALKRVFPSVETWF